MKFGEFLSLHDDVEFDMIVGSVDMPATITWWDTKLTDHGYQHFLPLVESECVYKNDVVEVFCDDYDLGEEFALCHAGYCSEETWYSLFEDTDTE